MASRTEPSNKNQTYLQTSFTVSFETEIRHSSSSGHNGHLLSALLQLLHTDVTR